MNAINLLLPLSGACFFVAGMIAGHCLLAEIRKVSGKVSGITFIKRGNLRLSYCFTR